jgi:spore coat protein H
MRTEIAAGCAVGLFALTACHGGDPAGEPESPAGFDACETPVSGEAGANGFDFLLQVDVGRTSDRIPGDDDDAPPGDDDAPPGDDDAPPGDEEPIDDREPRSPFELDRAYDTGAGYGFVGEGGEAEIDQEWTIHAWPYGGRGEPRVHLATRGGAAGYRFDLENGVYAVTLHLIEKSGHGPGLRIADLLIDGEAVVRDFDIFEQVGNRFMTRIRVLARVEQGRLDLGLRGKGTEEPPLLSAIEVEAIDPNTTPPAEVSDLEARGGYGQAILTWETEEENDLRGFNIYRADGGEGPWKRVNRRVVAGRHFVDHGAEPGRSYHYRVVAEDLFCNASRGVIAGPVSIRDHGSSGLPVFEFEIGDDVLADLRRDVSVDLYVPATLYIDGEAFAVEMRNRGASTRYLSKPNFKVRLLNDATRDGRNGFKLNSEVVDPELITEKLAYDLFEKSGAVSPRARYVHLVLAGRYQGVYTEVEEVDRLFFENRGLDSDGNLYRLGAGTLGILEGEAAYRETYEKKTNERDPAGYGDLANFIQQLNRTPEHELADWFDARIAAGAYIDFVAVNAMVANHDMIDGNQYLFHDRVADRWYHVPWDYNNGTFTDTRVSPLTKSIFENGPGDPWWFSSLTRLFNNAELHRRFRARLEELVQGKLAAGEVKALARAAVDSASEDVALDPWMVAWERDRGYATRVVPRIGEFIDARYAFLEEFLAADEPLSGPVVINELQATNAGSPRDGRGEAGPWIELYNRGRQPVSLYGVCLTPDLRDPDRAHCFREPIPIDPGQALLFWADGQPDRGEHHLGFRLSSDGGEVGLFAGEVAGEPESPGEDAEAGRLYDLVFYGAQSPGNSYGRTDNGADEWGPLPTPTPGE